jgi:hypothetical protein
MTVVTPDLFPDDLRIYLEAADSIRAHEPLYLTGAIEQMEFFQYAPAYALVFVPFLWLPPAAAGAIHTLLHVVEYVLLYVCWGRIFRRLGLEQASEMLAWTLPVWLICSDFWSDLGYLNVYILMALLATLLLDALLQGRIGWSLLWLSILLQIKPQWAFPVVVPLLLGRRLFFAKLMGLAIAVYGAIVGLTMLIVGPAYGWEQYRTYFQLILELSRLDYPWRTLADGFLGYNHSIMQAAIYLLGESPGSMKLAVVIKVLLLLPLLAVAVRCLHRPVSWIEHNAPELSLDLAFALYLGVFIWLDVVWEVALGIAVFTYLAATLRERGALILAWIVFMTYALIDFLRFVTFVVFPEAITPNLYVLTDPSVYIPLTMIVILTFYVLLIKRLWVGLGRGARGQVV